jgi:uncharacterized coiled-coil protein SlyX
MAWPWLTIVARTIPWAELARNAPKIIAASQDLLAKRNAAAREERTLPDEADEVELARRIRALEKQNAEDARAIQQLAKDVSELREGVEVLAARLRLLGWAIGAALVLAAVALWLAL